MQRIGVPTLVLVLAGLLLGTGLWLLRTSPGARASRERDPVAGSGPAAEPSRERGGTSPAAAAGSEPGRAPALSVDAYVVRARDQRQRVEVAGELEAVRFVQIGAEVAGRVVEITVDENAHVAQGDLLVRLDPDLLEATTERERAALLRAEAAFALAESELRRQRELAAQGVASSAELDRAESQSRSTRAEVAQARAALRDAQTRLAKSRIRAPFAGVVSRLELEPGAYLRPGDRVADLHDLSQIEIELGVSEREIIALEDGGAAQVAVDVYPGEWFPGRIARKGRAPDPSTRKYPVPVRVENPGERLLPGMLGTVRFEVGAAEPGLRIPRSAVVREFELDYLFVLEPANGDRAGREGVDAPGSVATVRRRRVRTAPVAFHPELLDVREGLSDGDRIALSATRDLRDGLRVRVRRFEAPL